VRHQGWHLAHGEGVQPPRRSGHTRASAQAPQPLAIPTRRNLKATFDLTAAAGRRNPSLPVPGARRRLGAWVGSQGRGRVELGPADGLVEAHPGRRGGVLDHPGVDLDVPRPVTPGMPVFRGGPTPRKVAIRVCTPKSSGAGRDDGGRHRRACQ
jgi:hypothetical protein